MTKAVVISAPGGPEVLELKEVALAHPGPGEIRIRQTAVGVNFHDVYVRSGAYGDVLRLPGIPGIEAAGVVEELGPGVQGVAVGDRVAYTSRAYGSYAAERILPAALAVHVPPQIEDAVAASLMVKGTTAAVLIRQVGALQAGDTILVHAAAGGVGRLVCQWARRLGVTVIGTAGGAAKVEVALRSGCHHAIDYTRQDFVAEVARLTGGAGVRVVFDSVGRDTFEGSLASLSSCGHLVNFGQSSGPVAPLSMSRLSEASLTVSRPVVFHYLADRAALESVTAEVFAAVAAGELVVDAPERYALHEASRAHADLESRRTMGAPVLIP